MGHSKGQNKKYINMGICKFNHDGHSSFFWLIYQVCTSTRNDPVSKECMIQAGLCLKFPSVLIICRCGFYPRKTLVLVTGHCQSATDIRPDTDKRMPAETTQ